MQLLSTSVGGKFLGVGHIYSRTSMLVCLQTPSCHGNLLPLFYNIGKEKKMGRKKYRSVFWHINNSKELDFCSCLLLATRKGGIAALKRGTLVFVIAVGTVSGFLFLGRLLIRSLSLIREVEVEEIMHCPDGAFRGAC